MKHLPDFPGSLRVALHVVFALTLLALSAVGIVPGITTAIAGFRHEPLPADPSRSWRKVTFLGTVGYVGEPCPERKPAPAQSGCRTGE